MKCRLGSSETPAPSRSRLDQRLQVSWQGHSVNYTNYCFLSLSLSVSLSQQQMLGARLKLKPPPPIYLSSLSSGCTPPPHLHYHLPTYVSPLPGNRQSVQFSLQN